ncbi:MAG: NAD(P)-dependent oxidoreductase [Lentisphaeria bacterium]
MKQILHLYYLDKSKRESAKDFFRERGMELHYDMSSVTNDKVEGLFVGAHELTASYLSLFPKLKAIQVLGQFIDLIDLDYCEKHGIKVLLSSDPKGHIIAEHAIGLALAGLRNFIVADKSVRGGYNGGDSLIVEATEVNGFDNWPNIKARSLYGSNVSIIGLGAVGLEILRRLKPFGCEIFYYKRNRFSEKLEQQLEIKFGELPDLLSKSDLIFFQLPYTEGTAGLISKDYLSKIKFGSVVVNCGRAGVVDEAAFIEMVAKNHISFAGLDVFWQEPISANHPLCHLSNTLLTPHMAEIVTNGPDVAQLRKNAMESLINFLEKAH